MVMEEAILANDVVAAVLELSAAGKSSIAQKRKRRQQRPVQEGRRRGRGECSDVAGATTPVAAAVGYPRALRL